MAGTFVIAAIGDGYPLEGAGYSRQEAGEIAGALAEEFGLATPPSVYDLLPEMERRFPLGARVYLGGRVHWRPGQSGTVTAGVPLSWARWPQGGTLSPWCIGNDGAQVHVRLTDGYESWWPARWLETREN